MSKIAMKKIGFIVAFLLIAYIAIDFFWKKQAALETMPSHTLYNPEEGFLINQQNPNYPDDPGFYRQWGLLEPSIGWLQAKSIMDANFPTGYVANDQSPCAVIIDIGLTPHVDLNPQIYLYQGQFFQATYNQQNQHTVTPLTEYNAVGGHGNATLGIMAATPENQLGIAGTGFGKIKYLAIDAHYIDPQGQHLPGMETQDINAAIEYVIAHKDKAHIVALNMSTTNAREDDLKHAYARLREHDIILVAAAGNFSQDTTINPSYPAASTYENVISVAELDTNLTLTPSSNFGENVSIAAPGQGMPTFGIQNNYVAGGGSSAAAPFITGTLVAGAALYNSKRHQHTYSPISAPQLMHLLYNTANQSPQLQGKVKLGRYVHVGRFMQAIVDCREEAIARQGACSVPNTYPSR